MWSKRLELIIMLKAIALTTVWYTGYRTVVDCSPIDVVPYCFAICYCLVQSYCEEKRTLSYHCKANSIVQD